MATEATNQDADGGAQAAEFDVIVIGGGPVGENVADRASQGGLSVVLVEEELVGGECSYWACMPSKALLRGGDAVEAARAVGADARIAPQVVLARRDSFAADWDDSGQAEWLRGANIELRRGHAELHGPRTVRVVPSSASAGLEPSGVLTLHARHAVAVCTGSEPILPPIDGIETITPWTNREATSATQIPESLVVVGGGPVGAEMATAFAALGSRVTLVASHGVLASIEDFAGELVTKALRDAGVDVLTGNDLTAVGSDGEAIRVEFSDGGTVRAEQVLFATGRRPRTADLGLGTIGIDLEDGAPLEVDDTMMVPDAGGWLYAVGDVNGRVALTHQGKYQARAAGDAIVARAAGDSLDLAPWGRHVATADAAAVPQVVFTTPQVACVGLRPDAARRQGMDVKIVDYDLGQVAGASLHADAYQGRVRFVIDTDRLVIVGATLVGQDVAELLHSVTIAVVGEVPLSRLWHAVPAYPTISEIWLRVLEELGRETA